MASVQAEVKELVDAIRANGYQVEMPRGGAPDAKIFYKGEPVLSAEGPPLTLHTTPSDHRWRKNAVTRLIRAGVLQEDPKKAGMRAQTSNRPDPRDPGIAAARKKGIADAARERQARSKALRGRMEHVLKPIGVWKPGRHGTGGWKGSISEVSKIGYWWGSQQNYDPFFSSESAAQQSLKALYGGASIIEWGQKIWSDFMDELETSSDPSGRYFDLLRQMTSKEVELVVEPERPEEEAPAVEPVTLRPVASTNGHGEDAPLHMRALALMAHNAASNRELDKAIELAQEIAALENGGGVAKEAIAR